MTKNPHSFVPSLPATTPVISFNPSLLLRPVVEQISISGASAIDHRPFDHPPLGRRIANRPSQAEIARTMRAIKQVGGGFEMEIMPDRIRLAPSQGAPGATSKPQKPREFVL
jgi:hypothetical protein